MTDGIRKDESDEPEAYEAPAIEDLETETGPSITSAGLTTD